MLAINVEQDPIDCGRELYLKTFVQFKPGVTILVGCNGAGKTTLLNVINRSFKNDKETVCIHYDNLRDGGQNSLSSAVFYGKMDFAARYALSSEGENIVLNFGELACDIGKKVRSKPGCKRIVVTLDGVDSGLSIDNILDVKEFFDFLLKENSTKEVYTIASANSYELARDEDCIKTHELEHYTFSDYDEYRNYILESRMLKDKQLNRK